MARLGFLNSSQTSTGGGGRTSRAPVDDKKRFSGGLFSDLMDTISIPQGALIGAVKGDIGKGISERQSWGDITGDSGIGKVAGFVGDVVLDPMNLVAGAGIVSKVAKGAKATKAATQGLKTAQAVSKATTREEVISALGEPLAKKLANKTDDVTEIVESVGKGKVDVPLYHGTDSVSDILSSGKITQGRPSPLRGFGDNTGGVSTSRSAEKALEYGDSALVINRSKVSNNTKIKPIDVDGANKLISEGKSTRRPTNWTDLEKRTAMSYDKTKGSLEERIFGDVDIKNVDEILIRQDADQAYIESVQKLAKEKGIPSRVVNPKLSQPNVGKVGGDVIDALVKETDPTKIAQLANLDASAIISASDDAVTAVVKASKAGQFKAGQRASMISKQKAGRIEAGAKEFSESMKTGNFDRFEKAFNRQFKGAYTKPGIRPLKELITPEQFKDLKNMSTQSGDIFDTKAIGDALTGMYEHGALPAKEVLGKMEQVYGRDVVSAVRKMSGSKTGILEGLFGLPRSIKASFDISMGARQGLAVAARNPKEWAVANKESLKYLANPKYYKEEMAKLGKMAKVNGANEYGLAVYAAKGGTEEVYAGAKELAELVPLLGRGVTASERAYSGGLVKLRLSLWNKHLKNLGGFQNAKQKIGEKGMRDLAEVLNTLTGVGGKKGGFLSKHATTLNQTLFSPKLWAARLQPFNPLFWKRLSPTARKVAFENMASFVGTAGAALTAAAAAGAKVETDSRSADFLKIRVGDTRYDILGGFQQNIVFASRQITNSSKSSTSGKITKYGENFGGQTRKSALYNLIENKTNPSLSIGLQALEGKNKITGEELDLKLELQKLFVPLAMEGSMEAFDEEGAIGLAKSVPEYMGIGAQTYSGKKTTRKSAGRLKFLDKK